MATAKFNTNIETPAKANSYDLDRVITKDGFGNAILFKYALDKLYVGVSLVGNKLSIAENAYGEISVTVSADGKNPIKATAATKLYGFYATRLDIINNESTMAILSQASANVKKEWPTLMGAEVKASPDGPGVPVNPGTGVKKP